MADSASLKKQTARYKGRSGDLFQIPSPFIDGDPEENFVHELFGGNSNAITFEAGPRDFRRVKSTADTTTYYDRRLPLMRLLGEDESQPQGMFYWDESLDPHGDLDYLGERMVCDASCCKRKTR